MWRLHDQGPSASSSPARRQEVATEGERRGGGGDYVSPYHIILLSEIYNQIHELYSIYPHLCTLTLAQELYSLPAAGSSDKDCSRGHINGRNGSRGGVGARMETVTVL